MTNTSNEKRSNKIKSFIYVDEYKMYSISSQIFNGLTEYVTSYSHKSSQDLERQDGPVGSGRILADIISNQSSTEERKFLHDYSYNLFEEKLIEDKRVLQINLNNIGEEISKIENYDFIKVQGRLLFSDIRIMNDTIENFNKIGEALFFISNFHDLEKLKSQYDQTLTKQQNKINKGFAQTSNHQKSDIETLAYKAGLQFDKVFLEKLSFILKYGYRDQFEIKSYLSTIAANYLFSAVLKREYLREDEDLIVKKYSRYSEKEFVVFGTVTQSNDHQDDLPPEANADDMKEVISQLVLKLSDVEKQFIGKRKNEIIIDPIAVYREF
jgi:hypothetical protein